MIGARRRVVILTEIIAPYRTPVFNALAATDGIDLHVIFLSETDSGLREWRVYRDEIRFSHQVLRSHRVRVGTRNYLLNWGLWSALDERDPHVIVCGGYNYTASWEAMAWARRRRAKFLLWSESNIMDQRNHHTLTEALKRYFVRHCDGFVAAGISAMEYVQSLGGAAERIAIAPNAVDNEYFRREAEAARGAEDTLRARLNLPRRYILFVGRLVPEKGVLDLLEAYAKLEDSIRSEVGLVFAGGGVLQSEIASRSARVKPGSVYCCGFAQRDNLAKYYGLAEILVLPTHTDPWGLVVNEGMACGLPVIVSRVAGCARDLVEEGLNGCVVRERDPEQLSRAMTWMLRQPELEKKRMGERSQERIQRYSPEACARGFAESFR